MSTHVSLAAKATFLDTILPVLLLVLPACSLFDVDGNGQRTEENRDLHDFSSVTADGSLDVQVRQSDTTSVMVSIDSNLQRLSSAWKAPAICAPRISAPRRPTSG